MENKKNPTKELTKFLDSLRTSFYALPINDRNKAWDILSALRGPDYPCGYDDKAATTAIIRLVVFQRVIPNAAIGEDGVGAARHRKQLSRHNMSAHFKTHAKLAFEALGLKWDKANVKTKKIRKAAIR